MYQTMYLHLFNAVTDALRALEENHPERAKVLLIDAQQHTESIYVEHPPQQ